MFVLQMMLWGCSENLTPYAPMDRDTAALCIPNVDGQLDASEFPLNTSGTGLYMVAENTTVEYRLGQTETGTPIWDFGGGLETGSLESISVEAFQSYGDAWFSSDYPTAEWVISNDGASTTVGLYTFDENTLSTLGLVSPEDPNSNHIVYASAVPLIRFPLQVGDAYTSAGVVEGGVSNGLPFSGIHRYEVSVERNGELWLSNYRFVDVYMVDTKLTVAPNIGEGFWVLQRSFYSECFGELVRLQSNINATESGFTNMASIRILYAE